MIVVLLPVLPVSQVGIGAGVSVLLPEEVVVLVGSPTVMAPTRRITVRTSLLCMSSDPVPKKKQLRAISIKITHEMGPKRHLYTVMFV